MGRFNNAADQIRNQEDNQGESQDFQPIFNLPEDTDWFKESKGNNLIDIIPFEVTTNNHFDALNKRGKNNHIAKGSIFYRRQIMVHYRVGPEEKRCICPRTVGKDCPICDQAFEKYDKGNGPLSKDDLKKQLPSNRELYNIMDATDEEAPVMPWLVSCGNFGKLFDQIKVTDPDNLRFANLENGKSVEVTFLEETMEHLKNKPTFLKAGSITFKDRDYDIPENVAEEETYDLNDILIIHDYDTIYAWMMGEDTEDGDVQEESEEEDDIPMSNNACPHGHKWGTAEEHSECPECADKDEKLWESCKEADDGESKKERKPEKKQQSDEKPKLKRRRRKK